MKRLVRWLKAVGSILVLFGLMQCVPYGRTHSNPPISKEPAWNSPRTRELAKRACFDCHSNETKWPWYADVAPMSWIVQRDVEQARTVINFSQWDLEYAHAEYSGESVLTGSMPPSKYRMAHPEAQLTKQEREELIDGLNATMGAPFRN